MSEIKRNLPNSAYEAATNSTATGADPNAPLSAITNSDLEATLTRGDTTADGQVIKAENGGGQLNLRVGADNIAEITTDNGGYGTPYLYLGPNYTELLSTDGGLFFSSSDKRASLFQKDGFNQFGVHINASEAVDGGVSLTKGLYVLNNKINQQGSDLQDDPAAVIINAEATVNSGVEASVVLGGTGTIAKTSYTAYVRQIGFHEAGTIEGLLNNKTLTQDRTWFFQDESGEIPVAPGWNTLIANPTATEDGFIISWNNTTGEFELKADGVGSNTNLSIGTKTATTLDINSSDGTNATVPQATITEAGLMSAADKIKVNNTSGTNTGDEFLSFANLAAFPVTGESGKIYLAIDTNKIYSWTGAAYSEISPASANGLFDATNSGGTIPTTFIANIADLLTFIGNLTVTGTTSLDGGVTVNESGADVDFRIESATNPNLFQTDGANSNVNIGGAGDATNKLYVLVNELTKQSGCAVDILSSVSVYGVRAEVSNSVDTAITGVYGDAKGSAIGTTNRGVAGEAVFGFGSIKNYGVFGRAGDADEENVGVYGLDIFGHPTSTLSAGTYGSSQGNSPENNGAYGHVSGGGAATLRSYALRGFNQTSKDNATNYGIHALISLMSGTTGTTNYAAYLDSVSVDPGTHYGLVVASAINSGFNVTAPTALVHIDGSVRIEGLTTTPAAGYMLQATDANGNADWVAPAVTTQSISSEDLTNQIPPAVDSPIQVKFGPAISDANVSLDALGTLTILTDGFYSLRARFSVGRASNPGTARLFLRLVYTPNGGGAIYGTPINFVLPSINSTDTFEFTNQLSLSTGDTLSVEIYQDSLGVNDGGLFSYTPSLVGWTQTPSASVSVLVTK